MNRAFDTDIIVSYHTKIGKDYFIYQLNSKWLCHLALHTLNSKCFELIQDYTFIAKRSQSVSYKVSSEEYDRAYVTLDQSQKNNYQYNFLDVAGVDSFDQFLPIVDGRFDLSFRTCAIQLGEDDWAYTSYGYEPSKEWEGN